MLSWIVTKETIIKNKQTSKKQQYFVCRMLSTLQNVVGRCFDVSPYIIESIWMVSIFW